MTSSTGQEQQGTLELQQDKKGADPVECLGLTFENDQARREHFLALLKEKLKDPEFRKIPGFPKGNDEDILRTSNPPYYTACPNPFLQDLVSFHSSNTPADDEMMLSRTPFAADTSGGKNDSIYNAHAYHTKTPWPVVQQYIEHYTSQGAIVLDAFSGAGMTGVAGRHSNGNRLVILSELSPAGSFIGSQNGSERNPVRDRKLASEILRDIRKKHDWMYETLHTGWSAAIRDHREAGNSESGSSVKGEIQFTLWSDVLSCPQCASQYTYWNAAVDYEEEKMREVYPCPNCSSNISKQSSDPVYEAGWDSLLDAPCKRVLQVPALINYKVGTRRYEKFPDEHDVSIINKVKGMPLSPSVPLAKMQFRDAPWGEMFRAGYHAGMTHAHHFYWHRALLVLADVFDKIKDNTSLLYWFTSTLPWCNRENRLSVGNYFGKKGGVITSYRGAIYIASLGVETNPIERLSLRITSALISDPKSNSQVAITNQSSESLAMPDNSVDYIFIDPPFGDNLIYSELNFLWESWLGLWTESRPEVLISKYHKKDIFSYTSGMKSVLKELNRILKPGHWMTVQFHNSKNSVWNAIQASIFEAGFVIADVRTMDKGKSSFKQVVAAGAVKKDLVISCYKPQGLASSNSTLLQSEDGHAWSFVREHLARLPIWIEGQDMSSGEVIVERQGYVLFDRMVAFLIQKGLSIPLSASEFYSGLQQRFPEREGMFFLADQVVEYDRKRTSVSELRQLNLFISDEASAIKWVRQQLQLRPRSFQELQPQFMQEVKTWSKHEKSVELLTILSQSFLLYEGRGPVPSQIHSYLSTNFKDLRNLVKEDLKLIEKAGDRWYVPDPSKQADLDQIRDRALLKEFEELKESSQRKIKQFRTEAVRAGFKACWQERDYATIVKVAAKLPEAVLQEDEKLLMYIDNAQTRLGDD